MSALAPGAIFYSRQMKLNRQTHLIVLEEVACIKAGGAINGISPATRTVIEALVGHPYEPCLGNNLGRRKMNIVPETWLVMHKPVSPA